MPTHDGNMLFIIGEHFVHSITDVKSMHYNSNVFTQEHIVTKIPEKEVCYIKVLATTDDWQSEQETREKSVIRVNASQSSYFNALYYTN